MTFSGTLGDSEVVVQNAEAYQKLLAPGDVDIAVRYPTGFLEAALIILADWKILSITCLICSVAK